MKTSVNFLEGVDLATVRRTHINWPNQIRAIVDGYRGYSGLPHGVQKDALQNAWDAREHKKGKNWSCVFEYIKGDKHEFITITDKGTTGLTGRVLEPEELEMDLPAEEKWGRFENVAFTKEPSEEALGSRGRGKFIFVGASKKYTILYDSLRNDSTYRFGFRTITKTESPIEAYDEDNGKKKLFQFTHGVLKALAEIGTRIIIVDPISELVKAIKSGGLSRYIGETWWEIILKYDVDICTKIDGKIYQAEVPEEFKLPEKDGKHYKTWIKEGKKIVVAGNEFKVKKLHIVSNIGEPLPEDIRGISIQRGGMKICTIEPRYMPKDIAESIYGYITLDRATERVLMIDEGPEHYNFDFRRALPRAIKSFVEDEMAKFAKDKLGWGADVREIRRQQQRNAERKALLAINRLAKEIGFIGVGKGPRTKKTTSVERKKKEIRIRIMELEFPRKDDIRVNYGETLNNIASKIINDSEKKITMRIRMFLRYYDRVIKHYVEEDISIDSESESPIFGPFSETFVEEDFPHTGRYTICTRIISMMEENKGVILDEAIHSFYLEEDPPAKGLFENCEAVEYPEEAKEILGEAVPGERGGYILQYNVSHPAEKAVEDTEDDLSEYLFRLMAFELCRIDLLQADSKLYGESDKSTPVDVVHRTHRVLGTSLYRYYLMAG